GPVRQVDVEPGDRIDLLLEADAALPRVGRLEVRRDGTDRLRGKRHGAGEDLVGGDAVGRVGDEVRAAVVDERCGNQVAVELRTERDVRHRRREVEPGAA